MKRLLFVASFLLLAFPPCIDTAGMGPRLDAAEVQGPSANDELITRGVLEMIRNRHLLKREIDSEMAGAALDEFVRDLDPSKEFFFQADIAEFNRGKRGLADKLKKGDLSPAFEVYRRYQKRVAEAQKIWQELLRSDALFDFTVDEVVLLNSKVLDYPKDAKVRTERLRLSLKYNLLVAKNDPETRKFDRAEARKNLLSNWDRFARRIERAKPDYVLEQFLTLLAQRFDRHTTYMSPSSIEEYQTTLRGNLVGIGVQIQEDNGLALTTVYTGSPAFKAGLKPKDRIVSIGQGADGAMVDITGLTMKESIPLIRGKIGSLVRLGVRRPGVDSALTLSIRRDKVLLPDAKVESRVFEWGKKPNGRAYQVGYLDMPGFYADSADRGSTVDARKQLEQFASRGVDLVILDMRRCYGGALRDAISLAGLFVDKGTVMQYKDNSGTVHKYENTNATMAWRRGLVVIAGKGTASGAEIVCAVLQDCKRALLVGDESTYGMGTVQTLYAVADQVLKIANAPNLGTLKVTTAQFYRVNGEGVQTRGVRPDIVLPSMSGIRGRESMNPPSAIGFDRVSSVPFTDFGMVSPWTAGWLRTKSQARQRSSADFTKLLNRMEWEQNKREQLLSTLHEEKYRAQRKENAAPPLPETKPSEADYYLKEVIAVAADYAGVLGDKTATPPAVAVKQPAPVLIRPVTEDPEVARRRARDLAIGSAAQTVYQLERNLNETNNKLVAARLAMVLAKAAYDRAKAGSAKEFVAQLAWIAAKRAYDEVSADKDRIESNLRAARIRYNQLKNER